MPSVDLKKFKALEGSFLKHYPLAFETPELKVLTKQDRVDKLISFAQQAFAKSEFLEPLLVAENMRKLVNDSTVVSVFEKPKFNAFMTTLSATEKVKFAEGLKRLLHGNEEKGFSLMLKTLEHAKLAKWPLISVFAAYYKPDHDVFIKPTSSKYIIQHLLLDTVQYRSVPTWVFYQAYRESINSIKLEFAPALSVNNFRFITFLTSDQLKLMDKEA